MPMIVGRKFRKREVISDVALPEKVDFDQMIKSSPPTPDNVEWSISPEELIGTIPDAGETIKHGVLWKLNSDYEWQERLVFLSTRQLCLAKKGEACLKDSVPLHEIQRVAIRRDLLGEDPATVDADVNTGQSPASVHRDPKSTSSHALVRTLLNALLTSGCDATRCTQDRQVSMAPHPVRADARATRCPVTDPACGAPSGTGEQEYTFEIQTVEDGYNSGQRRSQAPVLLQSSDGERGGGVDGEDQGVIQGGESAHRLRERVAGRAVPRKGQETLLLQRRAGLVPSSSSVRRFALGEDALAAAAAAGAARAGGLMRLMRCDASSDVAGVERGVAGTCGAEDAG
eukprot:3052212-Rhodomonas_salina.1